MIPEMFFMVGLYINAIVFHELGHWVYARFGMKVPAVIIFNGKPRTEIKYNSMSNKQTLELLEFGIFGGAVPLMFSLIFIPTFWLANLCAFIPYVIGCRKDLIELKELLEDVQKKTQQNLQEM